jgi:hypothetical protein
MIAETAIFLATIDTVQTMFGGKNAQQLRNIQLSNNMVSRRIDGKSEDLEEQLTEELRNKFFSKYRLTRRLILVILDT